MNILIIDDDILVATALKTILESDPSLHVCQTGSDGADAVRLYPQIRPDVLLMDIRMKHMSGLEAAQTILHTYPDARILFLTTFSDDEYIIKALQYGAKGYLLKQDYESIIPAIKAVCSGQSVFGTEIIHKLPDLIAPRTAFEYESYGLNEKEFELITHISEGLSNKEIAEIMYLSEGTIRNYLSIILEKLALRDRTQLAIFYYRHR